jgi:hypothetical protein
LGRGLPHLKKNAKAANVWFLDVGQNVEHDFFQTVTCESGNFRSREWPGHFPSGLGRLAMAGNHEQMAARAEKTSNVFRSLWAKWRRQNLERIGLENEIKLTAPMCGRFEQVGGVIFDDGAWESLAAGANRRFGNIERRRSKTPLSELLSIISQATTRNESGFPLSLQRVLHPETDKMRGRVAIVPRDCALPFLGFPVQNLKPAGRVALAMEFSGEFARSHAISHARDYIANLNRATAAAAQALLVESSFLAPRAQFTFRAGATW